MAEIKVEKVGDVKSYGKGDPGGKGTGLIKINMGDIPKAHKLRTRILTTSFYDTYISRNQKFLPRDLETIAEILRTFKKIPISVRSSATNEALISPGGDASVHAGENTSFMLPNNHPKFSVRFRQLVQAISYIYSDFLEQQLPGSPEKMAIVINPIPGRSIHSLAGPIYFPLVSGVASSFFPYALKTQKADEGFARLAFGHGYATVLDDFPVISMATIKDPIPVELLGSQQKYFYAIDMTKNQNLEGEELETMKRLHIRFAEHNLKTKLGQSKNSITLESIVRNDHFGFRTGLNEIMENIRSFIPSHFQIEFVFNLDPVQSESLPGTFHVVQLTQLPRFSFQKIKIPASPQHTYLSIRNLQGHGIKKNIRHAVVVSPFLYKKENHQQVIKKLSALTRAFRKQKEKFIIIAPGRLGSKNRNWGIQVEFKDIGCPEGIFEYGVDVAGRAEPIQETQTGGIYGSHFLYMIQGGYDEEQKRIQTRMFGTQGTHFLTNLMSNNVIYGYIAPLNDLMDPWFFTPPETSEPVYVLTFPKPVNIYADSLNQKCVITAKNEEA